MDERNITTPEQLEAALAEQRARRIGRLSRKAYKSHLWAILLPMAGATYLSIVYMRDREWVTAVLAAGLLITALAGYMQVKKEREAALKDLAREVEPR